MAVSQGTAWSGAQGSNSHTAGESPRGRWCFSNYGGAPVQCAHANLGSVSSPFSLQAQV